MTSKRRTLSKSRFKQAIECPTKLFYSGKSEYPNSKIDDAFLEALARGGYQVGALAQLYHPDGVLVDTLDYDTAITKTSELLKQPNVTIFEAALASDDYFIRVDVLQKQGNKIRLFEVKAKSFKPSEHGSFYDSRLEKKGEFKIKSDWQEYLYDVAYQTFVARLALPNCEITPYLTLANKDAIASVDGLNQNFFARKNAAGRLEVETSVKFPISELGEKLLVDVLVKDHVDLIISNTEKGIVEKIGTHQSFAKLVESWAAAYKNDKKITPIPGRQCKDCEFRTDGQSKKNGFNECWQGALKLSPKELEQPLVLDVWKFSKAANLIAEGRPLASQVTEEDIRPKSSEEVVGLSQSERQWLQVQKITSADKAPYLNKDAMNRAMKAFTYPLHFIDFETTMVAIPMFKGRRPYEQVAFQFSHHVMQKDGTVEHRTEYLNRKRGTFPNFEFVRALKDAVGQDNGTIFRYHNHENTVLCQIYDQLQTVSLKEIPDRDDLCAFIKSITKSKKDAAEPWRGDRCMVDLCELVVHHFYHPATEGSNSIKAVLPAILQTSTYLQTRYGQPTYGTTKGISSPNFKEWTWVRKNADGSIQDPYSLLPAVYEGIDTNTLDRVFGDDELAEGGAAMTAYSLMQFTRMSDAEADAICSALLKYCELDTLAMVMLFEYWQNELGIKKSAA